MKTTTKLLATVIAGLISTSVMAATDGSIGATSTDTYSDTLILLVSPV